jgi:hypothetical protein
MQTTISKPQDPPEAFADGWRSLSTELKAEILFYILPRKTTLSNGFLSDCIRGHPICAECGRDHHGSGPSETRWLSTLISIPDVTDIGIDLLFTHNTLEIHAQWEDNTLFALRAFAKSIKKVKIIVQTKWFHWKWLAEPIEALSGHCMQSVELVIDGSQAFDDSAQLFMEEIKLTRPMVVRTKRLALSSKNWHEIDGRQWRVLPSTEKLTELIKKNLRKDDK